MDDLRGNTRQRHQHKSALAHARVGDSELASFEDQVVVEQDVNINGAGSITEAGLASHLFFDLLEGLQQLKRREACGDLAGNIQEIGLIEETDRFGFIEW